MRAEFHAVLIVMGLIATTLLMGLVPPAMAQDADVAGA
jgi:hypothetical protein